MPRALALAAALAGVLAGCAADAPAAPVLGNPKVLVDRMPDDLTKIYVQGAFGERAYDRIALRLDNASVAEQAHTYALVHATDALAFHLEVEAQAGSVNYTVAALVRVAPEGGEAEIALLGEDEFDAFREVGLPWQKIVDEVPPTPEEDAA